MKIKTKKILIVITAILIGGLLGKIIFTKDHKHQVVFDKKTNEVWTCSMHPQIRKDKFGSCPICGMDLVAFEQEVSSDKQEVWTCSMHPQIRKDKFGSCPICGMDLVAVEQQDESIDNVLKMSPNTIKLANIQTLKIQPSTHTKKIQLNGKLAIDERQIFTQSSHIAGRVERLMVNFTGAYVEKGQVVAYVYSPELVVAQKELLEAKQLQGEKQEIFRASVEKFKNWKLTEEQIDEILNSSTIVDYFPILADVSGYLTEKMINTGDHVMRGQSIFKIANLKRMWVLFDMYESDIQWVKKGHKVTFTIESFIGEQFKGIISYTDPLLNEQTRVAQARVEIFNPKLRFKPGMFANGIVNVPIRQSKINKIVIPKSAVMWTGKRSVIYTKQTNQQGIYFKMKEVVLGADLGDTYIIKEGLQMGEEIVVNGTFSVDAAAQLAGKHSMMQVKK